jgi:hypothetical protein
VLLTVCIPVGNRRAAACAAGRPRKRALASLALAFALALASAGCAAQPDLKTVVDSKATYTAAQVEQTARAAVLGAVSALKTEQGPAERQKALAQLRRSGTEGQRTADLLTKLFPASTTAVPVRIERATVDGVDALVVLEAAPGKAGTLTTRRIWVLGYQDGAVLDSASFR